jgi:hypothetical protein
MQMRARTYARTRRLGVRNGTARLGISPGDVVPTLGSLQVAGFTFPSGNAVSLEERETLEAWYSHYKMGWKHALLSDGGKVLAWWLGAKCQSRSQGRYPTPLPPCSYVPNLSHDMALDGDRDDQHGSAVAPTTTAVVAFT